MANPVQFHKENGRGYQFIAGQIAEMDSRNPQIAARLALVLTRFAHIEKSRKRLMIKAGHGCLNDSYQTICEIVAKALAAPSVELESVLIYSTQECGNMITIFKAGAFQAGGRFSPCSERLEGRLLA